MKIFRHILHVTAATLDESARCRVVVKPDGFVSPIDQNLERTVIREKVVPIYSIFSPQHGDEWRR
ncbi:MAG: hypothetical protein KDB05_27420 [Planctomycetales bacterium]|nr:hypothetical protein [Planctomycetales bacterium]